MLYQNILLIDDDSDDIEIFIEAINDLNDTIKCMAETNPIKALENLKSSEKLPDLIFLDYNMPSMNGCEFLEKMREVKELRQIPVILYSNYSQAAAEHLCITNDNEKYITKPNSFKELKAVLKNILEP